MNECELFGGPRDGEKRKVNPAVSRIEFNIDPDARVRDAIAAGELAGPFKHIYLRPDPSARVFVYSGVDDV